MAQQYLSSIVLVSIYLIRISELSQHSLYDSAGVSGKKKLPPKTFLCEFVNGIVTDCKDGDDMLFKWSFTKPTGQVIVTDKGVKLAFCV